MKVIRTGCRALAVGVLGAALVFTAVPALAAEGGLEFVGGATHNTYSIDWDGGPELFQSGSGGYVGLRVKSGEGVAFGGRLDYLTGSGSEFLLFGFPTTSLATVGPTLPGMTLAADLEALGRLMEISVQGTIGGGIDVEPYVAFGGYDGTLDVEAALFGGSHVESFEAEGDVGYLAGVRVGKAISPNLSWHAMAGYRWLEMDFDPVDDAYVGPVRLDLSGRAVGGGITYHF